MVGVGMRVDQLERLYDAYREAVTRGDAGQAEEFRARAEGLLWELGKVPHLDVAPLAARAPWRAPEPAPDGGRAAERAGRGAKRPSPRSASRPTERPAPASGAWVTVELPRWSRIEFVRRLRARLVGQRVQLDVERAQRR
ncbi:MAG: hypothetical protein NZ761_09095 [Dehalococcoidia bacterium]|nr:hypothetical protein [Dehalococcoidia bacterium]